MELNFRFFWFFKKKSLAAKELAALKAFSKVTSFFLQFSLNFFISLNYLKTASFLNFSIGTLSLSFVNGKIFPLYY